MVRPREIGGASSSTDRLLYQISEQLERLIKIMGKVASNTVTTTTTIP